MFATLTNNIPSLITGEVYLHDGVQHPVGGLQYLSDGELAAINAYRVHVIQPPADFDQTGTELVWTGTEVEQRPVGTELTAEEIAARARARMRLSFAQMMIGLVNEGWITPEEGRAWRDRVGLPPSAVALISSLPVEMQFAAETRALAASEILRSDPLVEALGAAESKTPEQLDQFFTTYAQV
jgi:hypothetical protein